VTGPPTAAAPFSVWVARLVVVGGVSLICAGCGEDSDVSSGDTTSAASRPVPRARKEPKPARASMYDFDRSTACFRASPGLVVRVVEGRPLGGEQGTLRVDYDVFETQIAFARDDAGAKAIAAQAVEVAQAVGVSNPTAYTRRWKNVAVSWGAEPPTPKAVGVITRCLMSARG
jgi:hypothetical protein